MNPKRTSLDEATGGFLVSSDPAKELGVPAEKPPLDPDATALVLIDMILGDTDPNVGLGTVVEQPHFFSRIAASVIPNSRRLLEHFRARGHPVIHVRVVSHPNDASDWPKTYRPYLLARRLLPSRPGVRGYEWVSELAPLEDEVVIEKRSISAFNSTAIETVLRRMGVEDLVIVGVATNYGVGHTAIDAVDRGFGVVVVEDATAAYSQATHDAWLKMNSTFYIRVLSTDETIAELQRTGEPAAAREGR